MKHHLILWISVLLFIVFVGGASFAQDAAEDDFDVIREDVADFGSVDWSEGLVNAVGLGLAKPYAADKARNDALARRAAVVDARRNLLEVIKQVRIDSSTTVENFIATRDVVRSQVSGMLAGSTIVNEERLPDGSWRVTAAVPLTGELSRVLLQPEQARSVEPAVQRVPASLLSRISRLDSRIGALERKVAALSRSRSTQAPVNEDFAEDIIEEDVIKESAAVLAETASEVPVNVTNPLPEYTSLIVDARGLDFKPSLKPSLLHEGGLLYPGDDVNYDIAVNKGLVRYVRTFGAADDAGLSGERPLVVKAVSALGSDLSLSPEDAAILRDLRTRPGNVLEQSRVIIVF